MFDKLKSLLKGKTEPSASSPRIPFGRYSDNNKTIAKAGRWQEADQLFKDKKYIESISAFFDYLKDDETKNVNYSGNSEKFGFEFLQGSKIIRGHIEDGRLTANVKLAKMPQPSVPVMRRLLEMNFSLYYSRYALNNDELCMRFDTNVETANPSKLYYGLKELAIKSDKQDDLLVQDFSSLKPVDEEHIDEIPENEKQVKYNAMQSWIAEALDKISMVDADKFAGGISYLLLALIYRIDFLIAPEGNLLNELEKISGIYFKKDERQAVEKNRDMIEAVKKLKDQPPGDVFKNLFRSKYTFSIVTPQPHKTIADVINEANNNMLWYRDNNHEYFANKIIEYGLSYCQYSYSLPRPVTQLFELFMQINYPGYFKALGYAPVLYMPDTGEFNEAAIIAAIRQIQNQWREKYPELNFKTDQLSFSDLQKFNHSFATQIEQLNMDSVK